MFTKAGIYSFLSGRRIGNAPPPLWLQFRSSKSFILSTIVIAVFTDIFLYSLVVPVLPFAFTVRAGVKEDDLQKWTSVFLSVYGAALAIGSPVAGWFSDKTTSRRTPLLMGLLALGASTAILCAGNSLAMLVAGRVLQGLSASVVWTVGLALLSDTVEKADIGQAMGYVAAAFSVGALAGPLLGGIVYAAAGYYAVFGMGFAIIGFDIILRLMLIEKSVAAQWSMSTSGIDSTDTTAVSASAENTYGDEIRPIPTIGDSIFPSQSEKVSTPPPARFMDRLPPMLRLLFIPRLLVSLFGCFAQAGSLGAFDGVLPLFVKNTFHWNSQGAGLIFICLVVPSLLAPVFGYIADKYGSTGSRALCTIGFFSAVPFWVCLRFVDHNTMGQKVLLCVLLTFIGLCLTTGMAPLMAEIDHIIELEEKKRPGSLGKGGGAAQGFGLFNAAFAVGTLVGPLWAGFAVENSGWGTMGWSLAILSGVAGLTTFWWTGGRIVLTGKERRGSDVV